MTIMAGIPEILKGLDGAPLSSELLARAAAALGEGGDSAAVTGASVVAGTENDFGARS